MNKWQRTHNWLLSLSINSRSKFLFWIAFLHVQTSIYPWREHPIPSISTAKPTLSPNYPGCNCRPPEMRSNRFRWRNEQAKCFRLEYRCGSWTSRDLEMTLLHIWTTWRRFVFADMHECVRATEKEIKRDRERESKIYSLRVFFFGKQRSHSVLVIFLLFLSYTDTTQCPQ